MILPVRVLDAAKGDTAVTTTYYNDKRDGLGDEFMFEVNLVIERIRHWPEMYQRLEGHPMLRRAPIRRFPFIVAYVAFDDHIRIAAVFNTHMNTERLFERALN